MDRVAHHTNNNTFPSICTKNDLLISELSQLPESITRKIGIGLEETFTRADKNSCRYNHDSNDDLRLCFVFRNNGDKVYYLGSVEEKINDKWEKTNQRFEPTTGESGGVWYTESSHSPFESGSSSGSTSGSSSNTPIAPINNIAISQLPSTLPNGENVKWQRHDGVIVSTAGNVSLTPDTNNPNKLLFCESGRNYEGYYIDSLNSCNKWVKPDTDKSDSDSLSQQPTNEEIFEDIQNRPNPTTPAIKGNFSMLPAIFIILAAVTLIALLGSAGGAKIFGLALAQAIPMPVAWSFVGASSFLGVALILGLAIACYAKRPPFSLRA